MRGRLVEEGNFLNLRVRVIRGILSRLGSNAIQPCNYFIPIVIMTSGINCQWSYGLLFIVVRDGGRAFARDREEQKAHDEQP